MTTEDLIKHWEAAWNLKIEAEQTETEILTVTWWEQREQARAAERLARTALISSASEGKNYVTNRKGAELRQRLNTNRAVLDRIMNQGWSEKEREEIAPFITLWRNEIQDLETQVEELD
ncbi:MAG: hypothetical protein HYX86_00975 [Chloroflexi bacterium]|nr:hypothetical protein [Chloroflexota bacterium]